mmetsp:Transcript_8410/g.21365  ORF Transcript_8410/g.21365 Transcript_8410/m.21365 type:complete len:145 (-) Transcript_8410:611-1045(-)
MAAAAAIPGPALQIAPARKAFACQVLADATGASPDTQGSWPGRAKRFWVQGFVCGLRRTEAGFRDCAIDDGTAMLLVRIEDGEESFQDLSVGDYVMVVGPFKRAFRGMEPHMVKRLNHLPNRLALWDLEVLAVCAEEARITDSR